MTPKQELVAHLASRHGEQWSFAMARRGTLQKLTKAHKAAHDTRCLTHWHRIERWDNEGQQILDVDDTVEQRIFLSPPKNPSASRNQDRNWVLTIGHKGGGHRWEMAGTRNDDHWGAQKAANQILGWDANWVPVGWSYEHQDKETT